MKNRNLRVVNLKKKEVKKINLNLLKDILNHESNVSNKWLAQKLQVSERTLRTYRKILEREEQEIARIKRKKQLAEKRKVEKREKQLLKENRVKCPICSQILPLPASENALVGCARTHELLNYYPKENVWRFAHNNEIYDSKKKIRAIGGSPSNDYIGF